MIISAISVILVAAIGLFVWWSQRSTARMAAFVKTAIDKYVTDGSPIAKNYILIAYACSVGTKRHQIVTNPLYLKRLDIYGIEESKRDVMYDRINHLDRILESQEWGYEESLQLKRQLSKECFAAWKKFDPSIFGGV